MNVLSVLFFACALFLAPAHNAYADNPHGTPPGHGGTPPGHGGTPPGHQDDDARKGNGHHGNGNGNHGGGNGSSAAIHAIANDVDDQTPEETCRRIQLLIQDEACDEDEHVVRFIARDLRREIREEISKKEISKGCFGCIIGQFAQGVPCDEQEPCGAPVSTTTIPPGTTTTLGATTTTVGGGTTTTVPVTTTVGATTTTVGGGTTTTVPVTTTVGGGTTTTVGGGTTTTVPVTTTVGGGTTTTVPVTTTVGATTTTVGATTTTVPVTTTVGATTTTAPVTTSTVPATTTTVAPTTTTVPVTTTTVPTSAVCPDHAQLLLLAGTRNTCTSNTDCDVGTCNTTIGRCQTVTELDTGWTGIAHDADITDNVLLNGNLDCPGTGPVCGQCNVAGIDPDPTGSRNCRCANSTRTVCDQPFVADAVHCGATNNICNCYLGPPLALSAGNTPACVVNKFAQDVTGTTNVDTGSGFLDVRLRSIVFLGVTLDVPCPYCTGDPVANDGVLGGTCVGGANNNLGCDSQGDNQSFPAPGGDGHSLDCFPNSANVSGAGLIINLKQTTGTSTLNSNIPCGFGGADLCPCGVCLDPAGPTITTVPCTNNTDCTAGGVVNGTCQGRSQFEPSKNQCDTGNCVDIGGGEGQCDGTGPVDQGCDGVVRANGEAFIQCTSNADCDPNNIGIPAGACTLSKRRECFLPTITATGAANPTFPVGVATFCVPFTNNTGINNTAGLPGPGRVKTQSMVTTFCGTDVYDPGVGCPP